MDIPPPETRTTPWHNLTPAGAAARLETDVEHGLTTAEAAARRRRVGPNSLTEPPPPSPFRVFARQFAGVLPLILAAAAGLALWIGDVLDAVAILVVLIINGGLGFLQERRAERALAALKSMLAQRAVVRRDGREVEIAAEDLVPGDLALLSTGDRLPADGRLILVRGLEVDESVLTGESLAVAKSARELGGDAPPLGDRFNMAYANTVVTRGRGEMLVTATGMTTETGRLAEMMSAAGDSLTPLQSQLDRLGKRLAIIALAVVAIILVIALAKGTPVDEAILTAITLAVAAVPEGLPAVVTVTLALGMQRMARRGAIVKRLAAVETLGCATVVCSDKTGTLTRNRMTAQALYFQNRHWTVPDGSETGRGLHRLLVPMALCNDARLEGDAVIGDPTEGALLAMCTAAGLDPTALAARLPRVAEIPFESTSKFMATYHRSDDDVCVFVKGAPDIVIERCGRLAGADGDQDFDAAARAVVTAQINAWAAKALRVIAIATRQLPAADFDAEGDLGTHMGDLVLLGLVGLSDPVRPEALDAVRICRLAGIDVKMVTGDHRETAHAVADQLGLSGDVVMGTEVDAMDAEHLSARIESIGVFARVAPENKMRIVEALRQRGHVVAMTGDGVNDAPALKQADIGMAMGRTGSEVSKEAAAMVLTDDNFATIVGAVAEGRTIYANIVKFVRYQLSTNLGALMTVFGAVVAGLPMPFTPIQILWVNVIMDGPPAMALGVDPAPAGQMTEPPRRPTDQILTLRRFGVLCYLGAVMAAGTLGIFLWALQTGSADRAVTLAFTTFVLFQVFNAFNARTERASTFSALFFKNRSLWASLTTVVALQILAVQWPLAQTVMHTTALTAADWVAAAGTAVLILVIEEARKLARRWAQN